MTVAPAGFFMRCYNAAGRLALADRGTKCHFGGSALPFPLALPSCCFWLCWSAS
jgi:hypothetical protein